MTNNKKIIIIDEFPSLPLSTVQKIREQCMISVDDLAGCYGLKFDEEKSTYVFEEGMRNYGYKD